MYAHIITGTVDYLKTIMENYKNEVMWIFQTDSKESLLVHETEEKTLFDGSNSHSYRILELVGALKSGFAVCDHVFITEKGREIFEHQSRQRASLTALSSDYVTLRVLRSLTYNRYLIILIWQTEENYINWKESLTFQLAYKKTLEVSSAELFAGPSCTITYHVDEQE